MGGKRGHGSVMGQVLQLAAGGRTAYAFQTVVIACMIAAPGELNRPSKRQATRLLFGYRWV